ncbi:hypothetical protein ACLOJK_010244 [Asimina triloba]
MPVLVEGEGMSKSSECLMKRLASSNGFGFRTKVVEDDAHLVVPDLDSKIIYPEKYFEDHVP